MTCDDIQLLHSQRLLHELAPAERAVLERHLAECEVCSAYARQTTALWRQLGETPVPAPRLRARFETLLADRAAVPAFSLPWLPLAAALLLGVGAGWLVGGRDAAELTALRGEVTELHAQVTVALLEQASVSGRLHGVAYGREHASEQSRITEALISAVLTDPNVNVRLAAVQALAPQAVRHPELVSAVVVQDSPLVQLSLIDALLESADASARTELAALVRDTRIFPAVRAYLRDRLARSV